MKRYNDGKLNHVKFCGMACQLVTVGSAPDSHPEDQKALAALPRGWKAALRRRMQANEKVGKTAYGRLIPEKHCVCCAIKLRHDAPPNWARDFG